MRLKRHEPTFPSSRAEGITDRPPVAYDLLAREQDLDDEIEFDPRREISEKDWERMKGSLENFVRREDWTMVASEARLLLEIFPERRNQLNFDSGLWTKLYRTYKEIWDTGDSVGAFDFAYDLVQLFPDKRKEFESDDRLLAQSLEYFFKTLGAGGNLDACIAAARFTVIFPQRRGDLQLDEKLWRNVLTELQRLQKQKGLGLFPYFVRYALLLFPDHRDDFKLNEKLWDGLVNTSRNYRRDGRWGEYCILAMALAVLAAQDARITNDGQILITPKKPKLSKAPPPLPERSRV